MHTSNRVYCYVNRHTRCEQVEKLDKFARINFYCLKIFATFELNSVSFTSVGLVSCVQCNMRSRCTRFIFQSLLFFFLSLFLPLAFDALVFHVLCMLANVQTLNGSENRCDAYEISLFNNRVHLPFFRIYLKHNVLGICHHSNAFRGVDSWCPKSNCSNNNNYNNSECIHSTFIECISFYRGNHDLGSMLSQKC